MQKKNAAPADRMPVFVDFAKNFSADGAQNGHNPGRIVSFKSFASNPFVERPVPIAVKTRAVEAKSRPTLISLLGLNLRLMENWRRVQIALTGRPFDYESTMILMAVVTIGADRLLRSGLPPELQSLEQELPGELISNVNLSSIAAATAIPRETVRRKLRGLEERGLVMREKKKVIMGKGVLQHEALREIIRLQLDAMTLTIRQLSRLEVLVMRNSSS